MPIISRFYGIDIKMYFREHGIPHFHAEYGEHTGVFALDTLKLIEGDLPRRAQNLVKEWAQVNQLSFWRCGKRTVLRNSPAWNEASSYGQVSQN